MNTQNTLYAIDRDLNALYHEGHKSQRKGVHQFSRWQRNTVYAQGRPDPNAKPREKSSSDSGKKEGLVTKAKNAVGNAYTRHLAKNDAAWNGYLNSNAKGLNNKGAARIIGQGIGIGLAGAATGALVGNKIAGAAANKQFVSPEKWQLKNPMKVDVPYVYSKGSSQNALAQMRAQARSLGGSGRVAAVREVSNIPHDVRRLSQAKIVGGMLADSRGVKDWNSAKRYADVTANKFLNAASAERSAAVRFAARTGGIFGVGVGAAVGLGAGLMHTTKTYEGYVKRGEGSLRGAKMSPERRKAYKETFNKYKDKYSQPLFGNKSSGKKTDRLGAASNRIADATIRGDSNAIARETRSLYPSKRK